MFKEISESRYKERIHVPCPHFRFRVNEETIVSRSQEGQKALDSLRLSSYEELRGILCYPLLFEILNICDKWIRVRDIFQHLDLEITEETYDVLLY